MFARIFICAIFAGASAGLIAAILQLVFVQPVLLHAELYESGVLKHLAIPPVNAQQNVFRMNPLRDGLSIIFTMTIYIGYAFILMAAVAFADHRGMRISARAGIVWGIAGFFVMHLAPGFSMPPEVPGVSGADIEVRQLWWFSTVTTASVGVWLITFGSNWIARSIALVLILIPHVIDAPEPVGFSGVVPPEISALFVSRSLGVGMVAWVTLGSFAGYFWQRNYVHEQASENT